MNKQEFKALQRARSDVYQASKSSLLTEVRAAAAVQAKRIEALHHRQRVRFIEDRELAKADKDERSLWRSIKVFKDVRTRREKAEAKRQAEIVRRRREYWKRWRRARRLELARRRMEAMRLRSVEARRRQAIATEAILSYAPDWAFDLVGKTVSFQMRKSSNCGAMRGKVENLRQHHGVVLLSIRVPHSGAKRNLYLVSLNNVIYAH